LIGTYGFIGGENNQWYPDLVEDNRFIEQPYSPEEGYHLSKDLADQAFLKMAARSKGHQTRPRPWYLWFCPGANHAPAPQPDRIRGQVQGARFDDGYEASTAKWVAQRDDPRKGIIPEGTAVGPPLNPDGRRGHARPQDAVRPWDTLNDDEKKLFARMAEVYAGFSEYNRWPRSVGIVDYLKQTDQFDNTIIFYAADNGASGEGSPNGSVNENKFSSTAIPTNCRRNLKYLDTLGTADTYNHYPTGWAVAFSTPFQMFKRYFASIRVGPVIPWSSTGPRGSRPKGRGAPPVPTMSPTNPWPTILERSWGPGNAEDPAGASSSIR